MIRAPATTPLLSPVLTPGTAPARIRPAAWAAFLLLLALEFFLFDQYGSRRHTGVYPRWNDQIQYLADGYTAYERAREIGFLAAFRQTLVNPSAQGTLHDAAALVVFQLAGPSRSAALALNFLTLLAWQLALFVAVHRRHGHPGFALAAALLPIALAGPWENVPGSAYDFRLDHLAMCGLGVCGALTLLTDGFRSRGWSVALGLAIAATLLTRFLTGTYFVVLLLGAAVWAARGPDRRHRLQHLGLAAFIAAALAAPVFWINRAHVLDYYWIGHYVGPESSIRNQNFGLLRSLQFLGSALLERHAGWFFVSLAGGGAAVLALVGGGRRLASAAPYWPVGGLLLGAPLLVLTLHQQKSDVVVSALVPGLVVLVLGLWAGALGDRPRLRGVSWASASLAVLALAWFTHRQVRPAYDAATLAHIRQVNTLADLLGARAQAAHLRPAWVSVDYITDCLDAQVLRVVCYERRHGWLPLDMALPTGIAAPGEADVRARWEKSHFVFLTEADSGGGFPYDETLRALRPSLQQWCEQHLVLVQRFELLGRRMALYQRPEIPLVPPRP